MILKSKIQGSSLSMVSLKLFFRNHIRIHTIFWNYEYEKKGHILKFCFPGLLGDHINPNWKEVLKCCKSFLRKSSVWTLTVSKWMSNINDQCTTFSGHFLAICMFIFHKTEALTGLFEVLNRSYLRLVQKLWHKTKIFPFLFFAILYKNRCFHLFYFLFFVFFVINFVPIMI